MTQEEWANLMAGLLLAYPRHAVQQGQTAFYGRMLSDLGYGEVQAAVQAHIAESPYFPSVADIRGLVIERRLSLPSPAEAWEAANAVVATGEARRLHPVVKRALEAMGGSYALRTADNVPVVRAQFERLYGDLRTQTLRRETLHGLGLDLPDRALGPPAPVPELTTGAEPEYTPPAEAAKRMRELADNLTKDMPDG